jgi:hypothetical protein
VPALWLLSAHRRRGEGLHVGGVLREAHEACRGFSPRDAGATVMVRMYPMPNRANVPVDLCDARAVSYRDPRNAIGKALTEPREGTCEACRDGASIRAILTKGAT